MTNRARIPLLKIKQWLPTWDQAEWSRHLPKPSATFFIASVPLPTLRRLAGVSPRLVTDRRDGSAGTGYQRAHQPERSKSIARYLQYGYPLSNEAGLDVTAHKNLVHPGWLPTSILVNVIGKDETRRRAGHERSVSQDCVVNIRKGIDGYFLDIPAEAQTAGFSIPQKTVEPVEIIDGQHRLFAIDALDDEDALEDYEVPVVFFDGLTPSWQAYLFWVINVEPKKINPSLAYDLYPELRNQSWLQNGEGIRVYQEHRAQELTEVLWRHAASPWRDRIELHGQRIDGHVSNAAFIRSLMVSFIRRWGKEDRIGGLFGSVGGDGAERVLPWKRSQQAAFLILCWQNVLEAVEVSSATWVTALGGHRGLANDRGNPQGLHLAFAGPHTLLGTDQGARAILVVYNALCQVAYTDLRLEEWESDKVSDVPEDEDVSEAIGDFASMRQARSFLAAVAKNLIDKVDWRTSSAPSLSEAERNQQSIYRGSSGYSQLQVRCFESLKTSGDDRVASAAKTAAELLRR